MLNTLGEGYYSRSLAAACDGGGDRVQGVNKDEDLALRWRPDEDLDVVGQRLHKSACQRSISRAVLADEYERSLIECMRDTPGVEEMRASHADYIAKTQANAPLWLLVSHLRHMREVVCQQARAEGEEAAARA